jgi:hypothetical protein
MLLIEQDLRPFSINRTMVSLPFCRSSDFKPHNGGVLFSAMWKIYFYPVE